MSSTAHMYVVTREQRVALETAENELAKLAQRFMVELEEIGNKVSWTIAAIPSVDHESIIDEAQDARR